MKSNHQRNANRNIRVSREIMAYLYCTIRLCVAGETRINLLIAYCTVTAVGASGTTNTCVPSITMFTWGYVIGGI